MRREEEKSLLPFTKTIVYYFNTEETHRLADGASVAGALGAAIPDPVLGPSLSIAGAVLSTWARSAVRRNKCIGVRWNTIPLPGNVPIPFEYEP